VKLAGYATKTSQGAKKNNSQFRALKRKEGEIMSVQKKSLISDEKAVKKAPRASQPAELVAASPLKAHSLTAHSMGQRKKTMAHTAYKTASAMKK
jgi:hypothetical protein